MTVAGTTSCTLFQKLPAHPDHTLAAVPGAVETLQREAGRQFPHATEADLVETFETGDQQQIDRQQEEHQEDDHHAIDDHS
jgi:hypothetical protein